MSASYEIWLDTPDGARKEILSDWYSLSLARTVNRVGSLILRLPVAGRNLWTFPVDTRLEVWRRIDGVTDWQLLTDTVWFLRRITRGQDDAHEYIEMVAYSAAEILSRRIVAYNAGAAEADKTGAADDMCKAVVRENFTAPTDTTRGISSYMTCAADYSLGPSISKAFSRRNVLDVLTEIADSSAAHSTTPTRLYWDVLARQAANPSGAGGTFYDLWFDTWVNQRGTDHATGSAAPVIFSTNYGNLVNPTVTTDYTDELTYVYGAGQGEGADRLVVSASDAHRLSMSPLNRREGLFDGRNYSTSAALTSAAREKLQSGRPVTTFSGRILDTSIAAMGLHWTWGDRVIAEYAGIQYDCVVRSLQVWVQDGAETIEAGLEA